MAAGDVKKPECDAKHLPLDGTLKRLERDMATVLRTLSGDPANPLVPGVAGVLLLLDNNMKQALDHLKAIDSQGYEVRVKELETTLVHMRKKQVFPWLKVTLAMLGISTASMVFTAALLTLAVKFLFVATG